MDPQNPPQSPNQDPSQPVTNPEPPAPSAPPAPPAEAQSAEQKPSEPLALPQTWPGGFGAYKFSKQAVKLNLGAIVLVWVASFLVSIVLGLAIKRVGQLVADLISPLFAAAAIYLYIAGTRNQKVSVGDALSKGVSLWLKMILLTILIVLSLIGSLILLIIPFFFVAPRLALAEYFLVDKNMGVLEAYKASWHATKGNVGKVYGTVGAAIAMALLMVTIIGIPFAIYFLIMYSAVYAVLYEFVLHQQPEQPAAAAPAAPVS